MSESQEANGMTRDLQAVADVCDEASAVVLVAGLPPTAAKGDMSVPWAVDQLVFGRKLATEEPMTWIASTLTNYLAEAAHELRAIAALRRAEVITGSLGPLVRAILERIGVICWIIELQEPPADETDEAAVARRVSEGRERGWRAMLNALVCYKAYRKRRWNN